MPRKSTAIPAVRMPDEAGQGAGPPAMPQYLTAREVAQWLRLSLAQVYTLVREGLIPSVRIGHSVRFPRATLDGWLVGHTREVIHRREEHLGDGGVIVWPQSKPARKMHFTSKRGRITGRLDRSSLYDDDAA